jgi:hypothetical protein
LCRIADSASMNIYKLIGQRFSEAELFDKVAQALQTDFHIYRKYILCLPLEIAEDGLTSILEILIYDKTDAGNEEYRKYISSSEYQKMHICSMFKRGYYDVTQYAQFSLRVADIHISEVRHMHVAESTIDSSKMKTIHLPDDLVEGFRDISNALIKKYS